MKGSDVFHSFQRAWLQLHKKIKVMKNTLNTVKNLNPFERVEQATKKIERISLSLGSRAFSNYATTLLQFEFQMLKITQYFQNSQRDNNKVSVSICRSKIQKF